MAPPEFADECLETACPVPQPHGSHCPRILGARLAGCLECGATILLARDYAPTTARCQACRDATTRATLTADRAPTRDWLRRFRPEPTDDEPPVADVVRTPTAGDRLRSAEATMRLRKLSAGHVLTFTPPRAIGHDDAGRRVRPSLPRARVEDDQFDVEASRSVMRYGGQLPTLAGYGAPAGA
ncbi:MAG: hypothetical protein V4510_02145 [bacterium]